jgi:ssDNA-binding Zn-finger/Zn-ribbon topoisomerase 1
MKFGRATKCYFGKWLTEQKLASVREFLIEMHRVVEWAIAHHETDILQGMKKPQLLLADRLKQCDSWLTARAKKNAFAEAHALVLGTKRSADALNKPYSRPSHDPSRIMLSETNVQINLDPELGQFDLLIDLCSYDSRGRAVKTAIPLKKHKHFMKWFEKGKLAKSVLLTDKYVQFTFEVDQPKKEEGSVIGIDPGAKHLLTDDDGNHYGSDIWRLLAKLKRKKRLSKAWYRCREEIFEYIDRTCKQVPFHILKLLVLEDNRRIKSKSKLKGRLSRNMRSVLTGWSIGRINDRVERLCEEHGVSLRRVPAFYNSTTCPDCGHSEKANRASQEEFVCVSCGCIHNADKVGAVNSLARFVLGPYGAEFKQTFIQKHPEHHLLNL